MTLHSSLQGSDMFIGLSSGGGSAPEERHVRTVAL